MKRSNRVLLLLGVALAALAFVGVLAVGNLRDAPAPGVETVTVVVAASDLTLGASLTAAMLATAERPLAQAADTFRSPAELEGSVLRRNVPQGHIFRVADFTGGLQNDVAGALRPGARGIAVAVDKVAGIGFLVQAGDFVDVILTVGDDNPVSVPNPRFPSTSDEPYLLLDNWLNNTSVKVLVQNVQVVATVAPDATEPSNSVLVTDGVERMVAVLAVDAQQAELVRYAQEAGRLTLVLRSPLDRSAGGTHTTGVTLKELVDRYGVMPPRPIEP